MSHRSSHSWAYWPSTCDFNLIWLRSINLYTNYWRKVMSSAKRSYSQVEKETLAVICGVRKFHKYLWGRHFKIYTDHKPLLGLLGKLKTLPQHCSDRLQRWALIMQDYEYELVYRPGTSIVNADMLSRLPLKETVEVPVWEPVLNLLQHMKEGPVTASMIKEATKIDPIMPRVL